MLALDCSCQMRVSLSDLMATDTFWQTMTPGDYFTENDSAARNPSRSDYNTIHHFCLSYK